MQSIRWHKEHTFLHVADDSGRVEQLVVAHDSATPAVRLALQQLSFGACVRATGRVVTSPSKYSNKQQHEVLVSELHVLASCDPKVSAHAHGVTPMAVQRSSRGVKFLGCEGVLFSFLQIS